MIRDTSPLCTELPTRRSWVQLPIETIEQTSPETKWLSHRSSALHCLTFTRKWGRGHFLNIATPTISNSELIYIVIDITNVTVYITSPHVKHLLLAEATVAVTVHYSEKVGVRFPLHAHRGPGSLVPNQAHTEVIPTKFQSNAVAQALFKGFRPLEEISSTFFDRNGRSYWC